MFKEVPSSLVNPRYYNFHNCNAHTKQLLLVTGCGRHTGISDKHTHTWRNGNGEKRTDEQTDVEVEIVV